MLKSKEDFSWKAQWWNLQSYADKVRNAKNACSNSKSLPEHLHEFASSKLISLIIDENMFDIQILLSQVIELSMCRAKKKWRWKLITRGVTFEILYNFLFFFSINVIFQNSQFIPIFLFTFKLVGLLLQLYIVQKMVQVHLLNLKHMKRP